jgi:hypothetical protein
MIIDARISREVISIVDRRKRGEDA